MDDLDYGDEYNDYGDYGGGFDGGYDDTCGYGGLEDNCLDGDDFDEENAEFEDYGGDDFIEDNIAPSEEYETRLEFSAFERMGIPGTLQVPVITNMRKATDLERFTEFTNSIALNIVNDFNRFLFSGDVTNILNKIEKIDNTKYKNPLGYVLGYIVSNGTGNINRESLEKVFSKLDKFNELYPTANIKKADVIRYGRYWKTLV